MTKERAKKKGKMDYILRVYQKIQHFPSLDPGYDINDKRGGRNG